MTSDGKFVEIELAADRISPIIPYIDFEMFCMANGYTEKKEKLHEDDRDFRITIDVIHLKESEDPKHNQLVRKIIKTYGIVFDDEQEKFEEYKKQYENYLLYDEIKEDIEAKRFHKIGGKFTGDATKGTVYITADDVCKGNTPYANFFVFCLLNGLLKYYDYDKKYSISAWLIFEVCKSDDENKNSIVKEMFKKLEVSCYIEDKKSFEYDIWLWKAK